MDASETITNFPWHVSATLPVNLNALLARRRVDFPLYPDDQWCGDSKGEKEPLEDRLLEFARLEWGNRGFMMMMHSILCDAGFELCDPAHAVGTTRKTVRLCRGYWSNRLHFYVPGTIYIGLYEGPNTLWWILKMEARFDIVYFCVMRLLDPTQHKIVGMSLLLFNS